MLKMETSKGWIAIIYDAPWARFKDGQPGVIVSDDGKTCETVDDDKSNIVVVADVNADFSPRKNGHILFKQKGTDLYDVVCLYQDATEHVYQLCVESESDDNPDVAVTLSSNDSYQTLLNKLKVYWIIDGDKNNTIRCTDYGLLTPTPQDFNNKEDIETSYTISVSAMTGGNRYFNDSPECAKLCVITSTGETRAFSGVDFFCGDEKINDDFTGFTATYVDGSGSSIFILTPSVSTLNCDGGSVNFTVTEKPSTYPTYSWDTSCLRAQIVYTTNKDRTITDNTGVNVTTVVDKNGSANSNAIKNWNWSNNKLEITVEPGTEYVNVILQTVKEGRMESVKLILPQQNA